MFEKILKKLKKDKKTKEDRIAWGDFPMSKIRSENLSILRLDLTLGEPQNSPCAEDFNKILFEKTGIKAGGSYFYGVTEEHTCIVIWVYENEISKSILKNREFCHLGCCNRSKNEYYCGISQSMLEALGKHSFEWQQKISQLYEKQLAEKGDTTHLYITLISLERQYQSYLYCDMGRVIEERLKSEFSLPDSFNYVAFSVDECEVLNYPMFLFFCPDDLKNAESKGYIEKMTEITYNIIEETDVMGLIPPFKDFKPQVYSRRDLSGKILGSIDDLLWSRNDKNEVFAYYPFGGKEYDA